MNIIGIIPARGGSKGIPKKNIKLLGNKPLIQYTSDVALESRLLSKVILSSDDNEIIKVAKELKIEVPFKRPKELAKDNTPTLEAVKHVLDFYKKQNIFFDAVCLLQVTSPFRTLELLETALNKFIESKTDSLVSVQEVPHEYNPHWVFEENLSGNLTISTGEKIIIPRRQELPKAYHRDGMIYITKTSVIEKENSLLGNSIAYVISSKENYVNIDTPKDWEKAEEILKNKF